MLNFINFLIEAARVKKTVVFSFGRMNPPTVGHQKLVDTVTRLAKQNHAHHEIVLSHSQDPAKNPLTAEQKVRHARAAFPGVNITAASKEEPTLIHHLARLHRAGHEHAIIVAGGDRVKEYQDLVDRYNGKADKKGNIPFNFKSVKVVSAGSRDPDAEGASGMSASKMRDAVKRRDRKSFHAGAPSTMTPAQRDAMFDDVSKGMGIRD